jgi:hypothetical protein
MPLAILDGVAPQTVELVGQRLEHVRAGSLRVLAVRVDVGHDHGHVCGIHAARRARARVVRRVAARLSHRHDAVAELDLRVRDTPGVVRVAESQLEAERLREPFERGVGVVVEQGRRDVRPPPVRQLGVDLVTKGLSMNKGS